MSLCSSLKEESKADAIEFLELLGEKSRNFLTVDFYIKVCEVLHSFALSSRDFKKAQVLEEKLNLYLQMNTKPSGIATAFLIVA